MLSVCEEISGEGGPEFWLLGAFSGSYAFVHLL
jgi:hypothetical protein